MIDQSFPEDRLPPQNLECEKGVIGAMLLDNGVIDDVLALVSADDFWRDSHQVIVGQIAKMRNRGMEIDALTLDEQLGKTEAGRKLNDEFTSRLEIISEFINRVPHAASAIYHAGIVREKSIARKVIANAREQTEAAYSNLKTADQLVEMAERSALALSASQPTGATTRIADAAAKALHRSRQRRAGIRLGIPTGITNLDNLTDGLHPGQLIVVAGRPGMGKSAIALNFAEFVAADCAVPTYFATLEMGNEEIGERMLASRARVNHERLRTGSLTPQEFDHMEDIIEGLRERGDLFIDDTCSQSVSQIVSAARRHKAKNGIGLVIVDYIQLVDVESENGKQSRQELVSMITRRLKLLARNIQTPVIALSQLNRNNESREDKRPRLSDLRESGAIEQDADIVILIHRPEYYDKNDSPGIAELIVAKNRNGPTRLVKAEFEGQYMRFGNLLRDTDGAVGREAFDGDNY